MLKAQNTDAIVFNKSTANKGTKDNRLLLKPITNGTIL